MDLCLKRVRAIAVTLSSIVALSLCPMLASRMLKDEKQQSNFLVKGVRAFGNKVATLYGSCIRLCLAAPIVPVILACIVAALAWTTLSKISTFAFCVATVSD